MGLDYGERTIGVAVSDPFCLFSQSLEVIRRKPEEGLKKSIARLCALIDELNVDKIIIGMPYKMNEQVGSTGEAVLRFKKRLEEATKVPVELMDERRSSVEAERVLLEADLSRSKRKQVIDKAAAAVILQRYMDTVINMKNLS